MKTLDLDLLRTLLAVVDHGSFAAAARRLYKTQSAVTQQMQRLEASLGFALFDKVGRGKRLTPRGEQLLGYARRLLALNDQTLHALRQDGEGATLRIGSPHDVADTLLPGLLAGFAQAYPQVQMQIHVGRSPFLMDDLRRGDLDMTVSTRRDDALPGLTLRTSPTVWVCAEEFPYRRGDPLPLILADEPSIFRQLALNTLEHATVPWRISYESPTLIGIKAALRAGLGVTARSVELLDPTLRVLGEAEGLPRLPDVSYHLYLRGDGGHPIARRLFRQLAGGLAPFGPAVADEE
ncbi:transcriptional regulator, LysR family [Oryzomicrobium terrae]|uniref:Transcriptional regulator, LysR family n=1 Tax=Oryzomicrobium terrae TaxID=1735038 RepID=A0A5C1ED42_9RHOO|nr:LysR substrate-binding domain-containing protein [Oryzomicrobium terrae]QEL66519.1 transcriptional regulator, LysR family [Oryzomicrobium terrae]